jgi:AcrR family transcriptional regulator
MTVMTRRDERVGATREALLRAAEQLFAERGVHAVGNRQISEVAGQGNNAAVSYHFGTKADVVRAIVRKHAEQIERRRLRMLESIGDAGDLREWVACAVMSVFDHLASLGSPSWYARFIVQVTADPELRVITSEEFYAAAPSLVRLQKGLNACLPDLPREVRAERAAMTRHLINQVSAERERALADGAPTPSASWRDTANGLIDVITALLCAPVARGRYGDSRIHNM